VSAEQHRPRVLVIEDDEHVVAMLVELLRQEGFEATTAGDGLSGLLALRDTEVEAVLLDLMMPDVDGVRVLEQVLEEHDGTLPVPILVVTGSPEGARRCRDLLGDDDVFTKPFEPAALIERLRARLT
jgi:DNA-binding response OmpR family regulator